MSDGEPVASIGQAETRAAERRAAATKRRPAALLIPLGLFALALGLRLISWSSVFRPGAILPFGNDAFYHLRRIRYTIEHFPAPLAHDPLMNPPNGAQAIWPPVLDWILAALIRLVPGSEQAVVVERIGVWIPPLVGAATVVLLYAVSARLYSRPVGTLAALILAVLPAHYYYSQLGFLDHHVFVAFLTLWMLACALALFGFGGSDAASEEPSALRYSAGLGLLMAASILLWPGTLLHVAVLQAAMLIRLLSARDAASASLWSRRFGLSQLVAALAVAPLALGNEWERWGSFSAVVLSNFQPLYFGCAALAFAAPGLLFRRGVLAESRVRRALACGALGSAILGAVVLSVPGLWTALTEAWAWLAKEEAFQAVVNESVPLLRDLGSASRGRAEELFSHALYLAPIAIAVFGWRDRERPPRLVFMAWSAALLLATLMQRRFMNSFSIAFAVLIALCLVELFRRLAPGGAGGTGRSLLRLAVAAALVAYALAFMGRAYHVHFESLARVARGESPLATTAVGRKEALMRSARWLGLHTPPLDEGFYSVLAPWGDGHLLKYLALRPVVQDNFGDDVAAENFELAERYFAAGSEEESLAVIAPTQARYVLLRSVGSGQLRAPYAFDSTFARLANLRGTRGQRGGALGRPIPALVRHRLVYESALPEGRGAKSRPYVAIFEIVEGAEVVGSTEPGASVELELTLRTLRGRTLRYRTVARADAQGRYRARVPYPTESFSPTLEVDPHYRVRSARATGRVEVSEQAVQRGEQVEGPSLAPGDSS